uniref:Tyrosinase n=1 Tax=Leptochiton asellus TaxID=211853 RepID=A0A0Y0HPL2_9MOLL|nr:tyrosinase B [Leptochiton asellus]
MYVARSRLNSLTWPESGICFICVLLSIWKGAVGQFPIACVGNATLTNSTCCPIPPGFDSPCGAPFRGKCTEIRDNNEDYSGASSQTANDDRFHWPRKFFIYGCECSGNFAGYMCHECSYGFTGDNCTERIVRIRKNLNKVTPSEKRYILSIMEKARRTQSDYALIDVSKGADPVENVQFVTASVYDYLAYVHYYASRKTIFRTSPDPENTKKPFRCDRPGFSGLDFAHRGSNFPIWHRYYMMVWEKEMQKLSGDIYFTFPYWNWTDAGNTCEVCTNDFLGASNENGSIQQSALTAGWYALCMRESGKCEDCDPKKRYTLIRTPSKVKSASYLPTSETVNFAMSQPIWDFDDYSTSTPNASFRSCLEGYVGIPENATYRLHNQVHMFFGGALNSATSASWDPMFYFHHSFMDKILEMWLRRTGAQPTQLPMTGAPPGHHRNSYLMAYFPVRESSLFFRPSVDLGYTYDDMVENAEVEGMPSSTEEPTRPTDAPSPIIGTGRHIEAPIDDVTSCRDRVAMESQSNDILIRVIVVETAILCVLLLIVISACVHAFTGKKKRRYARVQDDDDDDDEVNEKLLGMEKQQQPVLLSLDAGSETESDDLQT